MQTRTKTDRRYSEDVKPQPQRCRVRTGMVTCQSTAMAKKKQTYIYAIVSCDRCPWPRPAGRPRTAYPTYVMPHAMRCCAEKGRNKDISSTSHQQPTLKTYRITLTEALLNTLVAENVEQKDCFLAGEHNETWVVTEASRSCGENDSTDKERGVHIQNKTERQANR